MHPLLARAPPLRFLRRLGREPHRAAARAAGIAKEGIAETAATEDASIGERQPVATTLDTRIARPHVQRAGRVVAKSCTALDLGVRHQLVIAGVRVHGIALCIAGLTGQ